MFSKLTRAFTYFVALSFLTMNLSCTPRVGESAPEEKPTAFGGADCLTDATRVANEFLSGDAQNAEISAAWSCFGSALTSFYKYVRGQSRDSYTPQELATFLETNFLPMEASGQPRRIPSALQEQFMKLKQVFIGGTTRTITRNEIMSLVGLFENFKNLTLRVNPYMKVLIFKWVPQDFETGITAQRDIEFFEEANQAASEVARDFGDLIQRNQVAYELNDFARLFEELSKFIGGQWSVTEVLNKYLPIAKKIKKALTGGSEDQILADEWREVVVLGTRGYIQYLRYYYLVELPKKQELTLRLNFLTRTFEDSFSIFEETVSKKPSGVLTRGEIAEIFQAVSVAFPTFKVSDKLMSEVMKIKQGLFGGELEYFAASDFANARLKIPHLREIADLILPYADIYSREWKPGGGKSEEAYARFDEARVALQKAGKDLGTLIEGPYDLKNLASLLKEWNRLYPPGKGETAISEKYLPLLQSAKNAIFGDKSSVVQKAQWPSLLSFGTRFYSASLFIGYFIEGKDLIHVSGLNAISAFGSQMNSLVADLLQGKESRVLKRDELALLLRDADNADLLPEILADGKAQELLRPLLNRFLNPPALRLRGSRPDALTKAGLDYVYDEFRTWGETQIFLARIFDDSERSSLGSSELRQKIQSRLAQSGISPQLRAGLTELSAVVAVGFPMVMDGQDRFFISGRQRLKYDLKSAQENNLIREISRLAIAGYAGEKSRIDNRAGLTMNEAETGFREFRPFLLKIDAVEPTNLAFMANRFREANMFMPSADGNNLASFLEIHQMGFSLVSGLVLDEKLKAGLGKTCLGGRRPKARGQVSFECLYESYRRSFSSALSSMPDLLRFAQQMDGGTFKDFFRNALKAAGWVPTPQETVVLSDASLLPHLFQYIELIFARFDGNNDGKFSVEEARNAYPLFRPTLKTLAQPQIDAGQIEEKDLFALFTYILKYGHPPGGIWEGLTQWYPWKDSPQNWSLETDRNQMSQILGYIADQMAAAKAAPAVAQ